MNIVKNIRLMLMVGAGVLGTNLMAWWRRVGGGWDYSRTFWNYSNQAIWPVTTLPVMSEQRHRWNAVRWFFYTLFLFSLLLRMVNINVYLIGLSNVRWNWLTEFPHHVTRTMALLSSGLAREPVVGGHIDAARVRSVFLTSSKLVFH